MLAAGLLRMSAVPVNQAKVGICLSEWRLPAVSKFAGCGFHVSSSNAQLALLLLLLLLLSRRPCVQGHLGRTYSGCEGDIT
jgi:hypothetical protein